jgi:hypothetical protein
MSTLLGSAIGPRAVEVFVHQLSNISCRIEVSDLFEPTERFGHAFEMRVVRAEENVVGTRESDEALEIMLRKGFDPDVS